MRNKTKLLVTPKDIKPSFRHWIVNGALNPAGIRTPNKKIELFARIAETHGMPKKGPLKCPVVVERKGQHTMGTETIRERFYIGKGGNVIHLKDGTCRLTNFSHIRRISIDKTGFEVEKISDKPDFTGSPTEGQYGVEDPRITKIGKRYAMTYVGVSRHEGVSTYLAVSDDLRHWKKMGLIFREQNKDVVLFPEKINGFYVALHRPEGFFEFSKPSVWISYSKDLIYWGRDRSIFQPRPNSWEAIRVGAGAVPIKTEDGWLAIYHGVKEKNERKTYSAGAVMLDSKNPEKVLARSPRTKPLFTPTRKFEKEGFVNNVVFPTAAIPSISGKSLLIYYGAGDSNIAVKKLKVKDILNSMTWHKETKPKKNK